VVFLFSHFNTLTIYTYVVHPVPQRREPNPPINFWHSDTQVSWAIPEWANDSICWMTCLTSTVILNGKKTSLDEIVKIQPRHILSKCTH